MIQILISPMITEKTMSKVADGVYTFKVNQKANKIQIAQAIKDLYKVKVEKVNVVKVKSEEKLVRGKYQAKLKGFKKAIVRIKKGQKIPGFEEK